jgi:hypothetical protein
LASRIRFWDAAWLVLGLGFGFCFVFVLDLRKLGINKTSEDGVKSQNIREIGLTNVRSAR